MQELENFEGILVVITHLASNLDSAIDQRFLFKVEFKKPSIPSKAQIWKLKLPLLENKECELLAEEFDFSGGQIENIARKYEIHQIVQEIETNFETILAFCREESLQVNFKTIGFRHVHN